VLVRTDAAGATFGFAAACRDAGCGFSLGFAAANGLVPARSSAWWVGQGARRASHSNGVAALDAAAVAWILSAAGGSGLFVVRIGTLGCGLASEIGQRRYPVRGAMIGR
jgi:hypothetical protein